MTCSVCTWRIKTKRLFCLYFLSYMLNYICWEVWVTIIIAVSFQGFCNFPVRSSLKLPACVEKSVPSALWDGWDESSRKRLSPQQTISFNEAFAFTIQCMPCAHIIHSYIQNVLEHISNSAVYSFSCEKERNCHSAAVYITTCRL